MAVQKRKTRMYEPWGYREEDNYISNASRFFQDLEEFFSGAKYNKEDNKIHFYNHNGEELEDSAIDVAEFEQETIIEEAYYDKSTQEIVIIFTNGDEVRIDVKDLIDINEFADGLQVNDGVVSLKLVDGDGTEKYLSVDENGLSAHLLDIVIQDIYERIATEIARATSEEQRIEAKLDQEIERATSAETKIAEDLATEITRSTRTEQALNSRVDTLNDELDSEESRAQAAEQELRLLLTGEISRATSAETTLDDKITSLRQALNNEIDRATSAETSLDNKIDQEIEDRKSEAIASADYDDNNKTIDFYNANNVKIDSIDAAPFITGGMIDSVYVDHETEELVIVWITETGTEETRISLSEIFNPDDYYTKGEIDEIISGITESEEDLEDKIAQLRRALNDEIDRATGKEEELDGEDIASGNISSDATFSMTRNNGNIITFTSAEQIDLEAGEF